MDFYTLMNDFNFSIWDTNAAYNTFSKKSGINYNALLFIYALKQAHCRTQKEIADLLTFSKSTVHSIFKDFEKKGYLFLEIHPHNQKEKIIQTTASGEAYFSHILKEVTQLEKKVVQTMGIQRFSKLVELSVLFKELIANEVAMDTNVESNKTISTKKGEP